MLSKIFEEIKSEFPEIFHFIVVYEEGVVLHTSYKEPYNIPSIGENLAKAVINLRKLMIECKLRTALYQRLIFENKDYLVVVFPLGESSHLAFFVKNTGRDITIGSIEKYLKKIRELIDYSFDESLEKKKVKKDKK
jgi:hypothetical protein